MTNFGFAGFDRVVHVGTNGKMTEACAAMGLTSLEGIDGVVAVNSRNLEAYRAGLAGIPGVSLIRYDTEERCNFQYVVVEVDAEQTGISRDDLVRVLHAENVLARKYFWPGVHRMEPYRSLFPHASLLLPEVERIAPRVIVFPTGTAVSESDIGKICALLRTAIGRAPEVTARLSENGVG
jgi:dTDP-4-amino-4,6-dideoxygalactose transaminase